MRCDSPNMGHIYSPHLIILNIIDMIIIAKFYYESGSLFLIPGSYIQLPIQYHNLDVQKTPPILHSQTEFLNFPSKHDPFMISISVKLTSSFFFL